MDLCFVACVKANQDKKRPFFFTRSLIFIAICDIPMVNGDINFIHLRLEESPRNKQSLVRNSHINQPSFTSKKEKSNLVDHLFTISYIKSRDNRGRERERENGSLEFLKAKECPDFDGDWRFPD